MNQDELSQLLRKAPAPQRPDSYWDEFPRRIVADLKGRGTGERDARAVFPWAALLAGAVVFAGLMAVSLWKGHAEPPASAEEMKDGRTLSAMLAKYPGRLRAVIRDRQGVHPLVSDGSDVATTDPLWLEIDDGAERRIVATFSGQRIPVGGDYAVVLIDPSGHVMLVGRSLFWSQGLSTGLSGGIQVKASQIPNGRTAPVPTQPL